MTRYDNDFKERIINESIETGNIGAVAKKYKIPATTIHTWFRKDRNKKDYCNSKIVKTLKKELQNKELENQILRELLKKTYQVWKEE